MKGFILAAGMGTRLKPWTDFHPKALVPVAGVPMLERIIRKMVASGVEDITVNVFHYADQIYDFIKEKFPQVKISDERPELLETGGAILHAARLIEGKDPVLIHNADILSNADFKRLLYYHEKSGGMSTLLVSSRESGRKLVFDSESRLIGWHSLKQNFYRPENFFPSSKDRELAFGGIYIISPEIIQYMRSKGWEGKFSVMDFFLSTLSEQNYYACIQENLKILDIGKPDSLNRAEDFLKDL